MRSYAKQVVLCVIVAAAAALCTQAVVGAMSTEQVQAASERATWCERRLAEAQTVAENDAATIKALRDGVKFLSYRNIRARADVGEALANMRRELIKAETLLSQTLPEPE